MTIVTPLILKTKLVCYKNMSEIHVNPKTTYKGGRLVGMASNSPDEAITVQAFMICSLLSSNKDVTALITVKNMKAAYAEGVYSECDKYA